MTTLVFLLEEPSAKALLQGFLPRLVPDHVDVLYLVFEGKQDLEKNIARKLRAWQKPDSTFVVLRDQDSAPDCKRVKARLLNLVQGSGKTALVRVACRTLEAWVAGDLSAVATAFEAPSVAREKNKAKFREPDALGNPFGELQSLVSTYQKIDGARRTGTLLHPASNNSASFKAFCSGVERLLMAPGR